MSGNGFDLVIPPRGISGLETIQLAEAADRAGWGGVWMQEVLGLDALVLAGAAAASTSRVRLGTAIVPITTRSVTLLAMAASTLAQLAPARFHLGVGISTPAIVAERHDRPVSDSVVEAANACDLIRRLLRGERVANDSLPHLQPTRITTPDSPPPVLLAALGPRMTDVALGHADGVIFNLLPEGLVSERIRNLPATPFEVQLVIRVALEPSPEELESLKKELASYARVPAYRRVLGNYFDLDALAAAPNADEAAHYVTDDMLQELSIVGSRDECRRRLQGLRERGVTPLVRPATNPYSCIDALGGGQ